MDSWEWAYRKLMLLVILCFVLSLLPPWPGAVSVSKLAALSPITGHAAPVTIKCCLTSTPLNSSISVSAPYHCWCCAAVYVVLLLFFVCSQYYNTSAQLRKCYRFGNQLQARDWLNNLRFVIPVFNWLKQKMMMLLININALNETLWYW